MVPRAIARRLEMLLREKRRLREPTGPTWTPSFDQFRPLPLHFVTVPDPKTQKLYFWNKVTNTTQWEQPPAPAVAKPEPGASLAGLYFDPLFCCWRSPEVCLAFPCGLWRPPRMPPARWSRQLMCLARNTRCVSTRVALQDLRRWGRAGTIPCTGRGVRGEGRGVSD